MRVVGFGDVSDRLLFETESYVAVSDLYPVSPGHSLLILKRECETFFELSRKEQVELTNALNRLKSKIEAEHRPDGYNVGMNCGRAAGQTVMQFHCHLIPRFSGDMANPAGGIRHCVAGKGSYAF